MENYVVGQVAAVLSKSKDGEKVNSKLINLFTIKDKPKKKIPNTLEEAHKEVHVSLKKKKTGVKNEESITADQREEMMTEKHSDMETEENEVHWSKLTGAARRVASKESRKHDTSKDHRTIFVGNLPISLADKTKLKKVFCKYGAIENLRFRCPPTKDLSTSKRLAVIKKQFHPERSNIIAYVCYKEEFSAEKALQMNGKEIDGHHLRVDISTTNQKTSHNKSIFVGNLPFDIKEDEVRKTFLVCGDIENVRIIRDNKTGLGKGFCYVVFRKKDCVELALKLDGDKLNKREIRVKRCMRDRPLKHHSDMKTNFQTQNRKQKSSYMQPTNSAKHSFQGMKAKKSLKDKMKKRKIPRNSTNMKQPLKKNTSDFKINKQDSKNNKTGTKSAGNKKQRQKNN